MRYSDIPEIESFYNHPTLEGLESARDQPSKIMRLGALVAAGELSHEEAMSKMQEIMNANPPDKI